MTKDEISQKIANAYYFDDYLKQAIKEQSEKLDDPNCWKYDRKFDETISKMLYLIDDRINNHDRYTLMNVADSSLLMISIYYRYSSMSNEMVMLDFLRIILKEKVLLV